MARLAAILKELAPRAVIAHWPVDVHTDHVMTSAATLKYSGGGLENRRQALARINGMRSADYASGVLAESFMRFVPPRQGERCIFDELPSPGHTSGVAFQGARANLP